MATILAKQNGNWSAASTWSPDPIPVNGDIVVANNRIVIVDVNIAVTQLRADNTGSATPGGSFFLNDNITLSANILGPTGGNTATVVYSGSQTAYIFGNITGGSGVSLGRHGVLHGGGGDIEIVGNITGSVVGNNTHGLSSSSTGLFSITGNIFGGGINQSGNTGCMVTGSSGIRVIGNITAGSGWDVIGMVVRAPGPMMVFGNLFGVDDKRNSQALQSSSLRRITINGNIVSGFTVPGAGSGQQVLNVSNSFIEINGNLFGGRLEYSAGVEESSANGYAVVATDCYLRVNGNIFGGTGLATTFQDSQAINLLGACVCDIYGSQVVATNCPAIVASMASVINVYSSNIYNGIDGTPAIYAPRYFIHESTQNINYFSQTGDTIDFFTPNLFSTFSTPPASSVRTGVVYGVNTGTCIMPPPSAVGFGTRYDVNRRVLGTAINSENVIFNTLMSNLSVSNSIGELAKQTATVEGIGHLVASFSN